MSSNVHVYWNTFLSTTDDVIMLKNLNKYFFLILQELTGDWGLSFEVLDQRKKEHYLTSKVPTLSPIDILSIIYGY